MAWQGYQLVLVGGADILKSVYGPPGICRHLVGVLALHVCGTNPLGLALAVQPAAVKIPLGRIVGGCDIIDIAAPRIYTGDPDNIKITGGDQLLGFTIPG